MRKLIFFILGFLFVLGCDSEAPIQVIGNVTFGHYKFSPPSGYWYFKRQFPDRFETTKDIFQITFWKDKESIPQKPIQKQMGVFFNFAVSKKVYKDFNSYYEAAKSYGITYEELPEEAKILKSISKWSCKYTFQSLHGIECIMLADNLISMGMFGSDKDEVLANVPLLKKMLDSFVVLEDRVD